ncbi:MAG: hypothetical protein ACPGN3_02390, partial [Opitutales bacterium]
CCLQPLGDRLLPHFFYKGSAIASPSPVSLRPLSSASADSIAEDIEDNVPPKFLRIIFALPLLHFNSGYS